MIGCLGSSMPPTKGNYRRGQGSCTAPRERIIPRRTCSENYWSIPLDSFRISVAKNEQWEGLVKRPRDHLELGAFSPAHKLSACTKPPSLTSFLHAGQVRGLSAGAVLAATPESWLASVASILTNNEACACETLIIALFLGSAKRE